MASVISKKLLLNIGISILLSIPSIIFFARLFVPQPSLFMIPDFGLSDVLHGNYPAKEILSSSLKSTQWPVWIQDLSCGFPMLAEGQIGTFYLPNLFLFRFLPTIWAYNLNLLISFLLLSWGTYLFIRSLSVSRTASVYAAWVFTFCGYFSVHLNHFEVIQTASLIPLLFYSSFLIWQKPRFANALLFGFIFSQMIFAGYLNILFIGLVGVFLYLLGLRIFSERKIPFRELSRIIAVLFLGCLIGLTLSAIQLVPTLEIWQLSAKSSGVSLETVTDFPYPPKHLLAFINPYIFGNPGNGTYPRFSGDWGIFWENTAYLGILPLILSLASIFYLKNKFVKISLLILFVSLLLVLGKYSPFYFIFSYPPFSFFRVPSRYLVLTAFSLTISASVILDVILKKTFPKEKSSRLIHKAKVFGLVIIILASIFIDEYRFSYNYPPLTPLAFWTDPPKIINFLPSDKDRILTIESFTPWNEVFLKRGWQDMRPYQFFGNSLQPNYNSLFHQSGAKGYMGGLIPRRISLLQNYLDGVDVDGENKTATLSAISKNIYDLYSVRFLISSIGISSQPALKLITYIKPPADFPYLSGYYLYENPDYLPQSYLAFQSAKMTTLEELLRNLSEENLLSSKKVLVEDDSLVLNHQKEATGSIQLLISQNTYSLFRTKSATSAILVFAENNYPGWRAKIDGKAVPVYTVNLSQKGILLPEGTHLAEFSFESPSLNTGRKITIVSAVIIFLAVFLERGFFLRKSSGNMRLSPDRGNRKRN